MEHNEMMEEIAVETAAEEAPAAPAGRAFDQEIRTLLEARPELRGEALPEEVVQACVRGKSVTEAYNAYARARHREERTRQQNEAAAARAPVRGVTRGGSTNPKPEDPFLRGFRQEW